MKYWFARVGDGYGRWVPTGCLHYADAVEYMAAYPGECHVIEWLQL